jgi:hypothetical protein
MVSSIDLHGLGVLGGFEGTGYEGNGWTKQRGGYSKVEFP